MLKRTKYFFMGLISIVVLTSMLTIVFAEPITSNIAALYDNIKIQINGVIITPRDAQGNIVEPFIIDGTTYLPVRAVGEALGMNVNWNDSTKTVIMEVIKNEDDTKERTQPEVTTITKIFEDSFINKPLDEK